MTSSEPIFIIGNPRSGTSLLRLMITNHPEVCIPPECGFLHWWYKKYRNWSLLDAKNLKRVNEYIKDLSSSKKIETWNLNYDSLKESIIENLPNSYSELTFMVYWEFAKNASNEMPAHWGDKNNYYIDHLELLLELYPKARFIFIIRDGRDVASSYRNIAALKSDSKYKPKLPQSIEVIANEWVSNSNKMNSFYLKNKDSVNYIKFENLLESPVETLKEICKFLNIAYSNEMLEYYKVNEREHTEPQQTMDWKMKTLEKPDSSNTGKYKENLNNREITTFNLIAKKTLIKFGYESL